MKELCSRLWEEIKNSCFHLVFPARCIHCEVPLPPVSTVFCEGCASLLEMIDPSDRCELCFEELSPESICERCMEFPLFYAGVGSVFEYEGPPASLIKKIKYANQSFLAKGAGGFLLAQWLNLGWPKPDVIIPVPQTFIRWFERGYNQSELLAQELSKLMDVPLSQPLRRLHGDFHQANLNLSQRRQLRDGCFVIKKGSSIKDKIVLVVDDVMTSGATLKQCALTLALGDPFQLYALTLCRTTLS